MGEWALSIPPHAAISVGVAEADGVFCLTIEVDGELRLCEPQSSLEAACAEMDRIDALIKTAGGTVATIN